MLRAVSYFRTIAGGTPRSRSHARRGGAPIRSYQLYVTCQMPCQLFFLSNIPVLKLKKSYKYKYIQRRYRGQLSHPNCTEAPKKQKNYNEALGTSANRILQMPCQLHSRSSVHRVRVVFFLKKWCVLLLNVVDVPPPYCGCVWNCMHVWLRTCLVEL